MSTTAPTKTKKKYDTPSRKDAALQIWFGERTQVLSGIKDYLTIHGKETKSLRTLVFSSLAFLTDKIHIQIAVESLMANGVEYDTTEELYLEALRGPEGGKPLGDPVLIQRAWHTIAYVRERKIYYAWSKLKSVLDTYGDEEYTNDVCYNIVMFALAYGTYEFFEEHESLVQELHTITDMNIYKIWASLIEIPEDIGEIIRVADPLPGQAVGMPYIEIPEPVVHSNVEEVPETEA